MRSHLDTQETAIYVVALPVMVRHEVVSFALYGAHLNGAQLDPEEIRMLEGLAREAAHASILPRLVEPRYKRVDCCLNLFGLIDLRIMT